MNPGNIYNVIGVAYNATLYAYRVLGCNGYGDTTGEFCPPSNSLTKRIL